MLYFYITVHVYVCVCVLKYLTGRERSQIAIWTSSLQGSPVEIHVLNGFGSVLYMIFVWTLAQKKS